MKPIDPQGLVQILSICVSLVALALTVIGIFLSQRFYRDGVHLQQHASEALARITERTSNIQLQVGDLFDKTLTAALGNREALTHSFQEVENSLGAVKQDLLDEALARVGEITDEEQAKLRRRLEEQIEDLERRIDTARKSAEVVADDSLEALQHLGQLESAILSALDAASSPLTLQEIYEEIVNRGGRLTTLSELRRLIRRMEYKGLVCASEKRGVKRYTL